MSTTKNLKNIAKASLGVSLAGATALSGVGQAVADVYTSKDQLSSTENLSSTKPATLKEAAAILEQAKQQVTEAAKTVKSTEEAIAEVQVNKAQIDEIYNQAVTVEQTAVSTRDENFAKVVEDSQKNVDDLNTRVTETLDNLEQANEKLIAAQEDHERAQTQRTEALTRYQEAQKTLQALGEKPSDTIVDEAITASSNATQAKEVAYQNLLVARAAVEKANSDAEAALEAKNSAAETLALANAELASAQTALDTANKNLEAQPSEERLAEYETSVAIALETKNSKAAILAEEQSKYNEIDQRYKAISRDVISAQARLDQAQKTYDNANVEAVQQEMEEKQAEADELEPAYNEAYAAVEAAQQELEEAEAALTQNQENITAAEQRIQQAQMQYEKAEKAFKDELKKATISLGTGAGLSMYDFLINEKYGNAQAAQALRVISDAQLGKRGDATNWQNVQTSFDIINQINILRKEVTGLISPLIVSPIQMANAQLQANERYDNGVDWFDNDITEPDNGYIDYVPDTQVRIKFYDGQAVANIVDTNGYVYTDETINETVPTNWRTMSAADLKAAAPEFFKKIELYWVLTSAPSTYRIGVAVNTISGRKIIGFTYSEGPDGSTGYLLDEYAGMFDGWIDEITSSDAAVVEKRDAFQAIKKTISDDQLTVEELRKNIFNLRTNSIIAENNLREAEAAWSEPKDAYEARLTRIKELVVMLEEYQETRAGLQERLGQLQAEVDRLVADRTDIQDEAIAQKTILDNAVKASTKADKDYNDWSNIYSTVSRGRSNAAVVIAQKQELFNTANTAYTAALKADNAAQTRLTEANRVKNNTDAQALSLEEIYNTSISNAQNASDAISAAQKALVDWTEAQGTFEWAREGFEAADSVATSKLEAYNQMNTKQLSATQEKQLAEDNLRDALDFLGRARAAEMAAALGVAVTDPDFAGIVDYVEAANQAHEVVINAKASLDATIEQEKRLQETLSAAREELNTAILAQTQAQLNYDELYSMPVEPPASNVPDTPPVVDNTEGENKQPVISETPTTPPVVDGTDTDNNTPVLPETPVIPPNTTDNTQVENTDKTDNKQDNSNESTGKTDGNVQDTVINNNTSGNENQVYGPVSEKQETVNNNTVDDSNKQIVIDFITNLANENAAASGPVNADGTPGYINIDDNETPAAGPDEIADDILTEGPNSTVEELFDNETPLSSGASDTDSETKPDIAAATLFTALSAGALGSAVMSLKRRKQYRDEAHNISSNTKDEE